MVRFGSLKNKGLECQTWQICARTDAAPCAHFQKLDVGINKFFSNLDFGIFSFLVQRFFMVKFDNKVFKNSKKSQNYKKKQKKKHGFKFLNLEKIFKCMQELPNLHRNYSSGAMV